MLFLIQNMLLLDIIIFSVMQSNYFFSLIEVFYLKEDIENKTIPSSQIHFFLYRVLNDLLSRPLGSDHSIISSIKNRVFYLGKKTPNNNQPRTNLRSSAVKNSSLQSSAEKVYLSVYLSVHEHQHSS